MLVHQAVFGIHGGGHAFLSGSNPDLNEVFRELMWSTDLPATAPTGVQWLPFLRGFPHQNFYVLVHTKPDHLASRAGMVFSRLALIPLVDLASVTDLAPLVQVISQHLDRSAAALQPIELESPTGPGNSIIEKTISDASIIAHALVTTTGRPIVFLGQEGFDEAITYLWSKLPDEQRSTLSFRMSFSPSDVEGQQQTIVCTPRSCHTKWTSFNILDPSSAAPVLSAAGAALIDRPEGSALRAFAKALDIPLREAKTLNLLAIAHSYCGDAESIQDTIAAARIVETLSPNASSGREIKSSLVERLAKGLTDANVGEIKLLRNLEFQAFPADTPIWQSVKLWATSALKKRELPVADLASILLEGTAGAANPKWKGAIADALGEASDAAAIQFLSIALWVAIDRDPQHIQGLLDSSFTKAVSEASMVRTAPQKLTGDLADRVVDVATKRRWFQLTGTCFARSRSPADAIIRQLGIERKSSDSAGVAAALSLASDVEKLQAAMSHDDSRVIAIAAAACVANRSMFSSFDGTQPAWIRILDKSVEADDGVLTALPVGIYLVELLINYSRSSAKSPMALWHAVSRSTFADLSEATDRSSLWSSIPASVRPSFLSSTAESWLAKFSSNALVGTDLEQDLATAVATFIRSSRFVERGVAENPSMVARYFADINSSTADEMERALEALAGTFPEGTLDATVSAAFGHAVQKRRWMHVAKTLIGRASTRADFRPMLAQCVDLLPPWDLVWIWHLHLGPLKQLSEDDLWKLVEDVATEAFPSGPDHNQLWSRAGGKEQDLHWGESGRARWHRALKLVRTGGGLSAPKLLAEMLTDFPNNRHLLWLADRPPFKSGAESYHR